LFQQGAKPRIVQVSSRLATCGLVVLTFAFSGAVMLVVDVTTGRSGGIAAGGGTFLVCLGLWGLLPRLVGRPGTENDRRGTPGAPALGPRAPRRAGPARGRGAPAPPSSPAGCAPWPGGTPRVPAVPRPGPARPARSTGSPRTPSCRPRPWAGSSAGRRTPRSA